MGGGNSRWTDYSMPADYARAGDTVHVMPEVARSFYTDMRHGFGYFTSIAEELPAVRQWAFRIPSRRGEPPAGLHRPALDARRGLKGGFRDSHLAVKRERKTLGLDFPCPERPGDHSFAFFHEALARDTGTFPATEGVPAGTSSLFPLARTGLSPYGVPHEKV